MTSRNLKLSTAVTLICGMAWLASAPAEEPQQQQAAPPKQVRLPPNQAELLRVKEPALSKEEIKKRAEELRKKYPFESLAKRLAYEDRFTAATKDGPAPHLNDEATKHLQALELGGQPHPLWGPGRRSRALNMLHSEQVERFISSQGFGVERVPRPTVDELELAHSDAVRYPRFLLESTEDNATFRKTPGANEQANPWNLPARELLFGYHQSGLLDFAGPLGWGLVRDREHVAGFKSHQFRQLQPLVTKWDRDPKAPLAPTANRSAPKPVEEWVLRRLELVSLLKHQRPAVYVSATLPKMDELAEAETRELSGFEADSLQSIRSGESLVARAKVNHLEMFGALRAAKQCQQCHQVQRGELLGAFSYELHRNPEFKPAKDAASGG